MKKSIKIINYIAIAVVIALFVVMDVVAGNFANHITLFLCGNGMDTSSEEYQAKKADADKLAAEIAGEGIVTLKNTDDALPLEEPEINVFGWGGSDNGFVYMNFGSGQSSTYGRISLYEALENEGFEPNEKLCDFYNDLPYERYAIQNGWPNGKKYDLYEPLEAVSDDMLKDAKTYSDTAIVVLSRFGQEAEDLPKQQRVSNGVTTSTVADRTYLELTADEETLLAKVGDNFEKVIVVVNSANSMEMKFLDSDKIDAALDIFCPGNRGAEGLARILTGEVTPSGHLPDTIAYDHTTASTYANSGTGSASMYSGFSSGHRYVDYAENIYTGYYWYETADAEQFWDSAYAANKWQITRGYEDVVQYPFGYGLSYANFDWTLESVNLTSGATLAADGEIKIVLSVKNTHPDTYGQDVVQLYFSAPYYENGIEKPAVKLGAFAKTVVLNPGKSEKLELTLPVRDMASYDCYDKNNNGFMGYEAEGGTYTVSLRTDAHTVAADADGNPFVWQYTVPQEGFRYEKDAATNNPVGNLFTTFTNAASGASSVNTEEAISADSQAYSIDGADSEQNIVYMTRGNFTDTFPEVSVQRGASDEFFAKTYEQNAPLTHDDDVMPLFDSRATNYTLSDMYVLEDGKIVGMADYSDPRWDAMVSQLSLKKIGDLLGGGGLKTIAIDAIGKPACTDSDGPSGFNTTIFGSDKFGGYAAGYPCEVLIAATWNWKMAYQMGKSVGGEADAAKIDGWYGPACNIHRSPYGGRAFEYYSEDPFLSGMMCAYTVIGAKEEGLYAYVKHFAANETETSRAGGYTWMTEQTLREVYLRPFEITVKKGGTLGIMSSYNRIGSTRTSGSYNLLTSVLRDEWGFKGCVVSDYNNNHPVLCPDEAVRAGNDLMMEVSGTYENMFRDRSSATAAKAMHRGAKNVLYCYVAAQYSGATQKGLDMDGLIESGTSVGVFPWWILLLVALNVLVLAGCVFWFIKIFKSRGAAEKALTV